MAKELFLEKIESYKREHPVLQRIMEQLNIDEETYLDALNEMLFDCNPTYIPPLSNSSYLGT